MASDGYNDAKANTVETAKATNKATEYNARHIFVDDEKTVNETIILLDNGGEFSEQPKKMSKGPSADSSGYLGWYSAGQMVKPFSAATASLVKGTYTKAHVQTQFGWHVIILDDTR